MPLLANAIPIGPGAFGGGAVVESFEGLSAGPNITLSPGTGYLEPGVVGPFTFDSGVTFTDPVPNPGRFIGVIIGDFSIGSSFFNLLGNGAITSAADVPFGSAYLGLDDPAASGPIEFTFASDMLRVGGYVSGSPGLITLTAYDAGNAFLESTTIASVGLGSWPTNFIGLQRTEGIRRIELSGDFEVLDGLTFEEAATLASLDIKPGSDPNSVNLKSRGVLPVAILTSDEFDALQVDLASIVFGDPVLLDDGGIGVGPLRSGEKDVNGDGLTDLTLKFSMRDLVDNGALGGMSMEAILRGLTFDGMPFEGSDSIRLVPPGDANNDQIVNAADYIIWANNFGTNGANTPGDFDENNHVDAGDYITWANNFGTNLSAPGSVASAVPEPSTFVLSAFGLIGLLAYGWRRRRRA